MFQNHPVSALCDTGWFFFSGLPAKKEALRGSASKEMYVCTGLPACCLVPGLLHVVDEDLGDFFVVAGVETLDHAEYDAGAAVVVYE